MNVKEAKEALLSAANDLIAQAEQKNLTADYRCFTANVDLEEVDEDSSKVALIALELSLGAKDCEGAVVLECAVSSLDGEVDENEVLSEVANLKGNVNDVYAKIDETGSVNAAFEAIAEETELPAPEIKTYDNRLFYTVGGIAAAVILAVVVILKFI